MNATLRAALAIGLATASAIALTSQGTRPPVQVSTQDTMGHVYWTWDTLEPDTLASAWLLLRFAQPVTELRFVKRGEVSAEGTAFDVPLADLSRTRTTSTFGVLRRHLGLEDVGLIALEGLVNEVEITSWETLPSDAAAQLDEDLRKIIEGSSTPNEALETANAYLDRLHEDLASH